MNTRALIAEAFGTFGLTLAVLVSLNNPDFPVPTPVVAGLTLMLFVYTIGPISGCHINPAVTLGLLATDLVDFRHAVGYIAVQFFGGAAALAFGAALFPEPAELVVRNTLLVGVAELLGTLFFLFGIATVVLGGVHESASGVVIGGSLLLGISIAAHASNGVLNPAVALGIGSLSLAYVWGPIVGAVMGAGLARILRASALF